MALERTETENVSLDFRRQAWPPTLPLEGYLGNTRFRVTNKRLLHLGYSLIRGPSPKSPAQKLGSGPYSA